jgi:phosphoribosyl-dephospho-CoA transferase
VSTVVTGFPRHELVHIAPVTWRSVLQPYRDTSPFLATWADRGWPAIVRRLAPGDAPNQIPVGVPLPPTWGKRRVALTVPIGAILGHAPPPPLHRVGPTATSRWRPALLCLTRVGRKYGATPRPIGSLLWQHLTGLPYLSEASDIDLIWRVRSTNGLTALLAAIARVARHSPMRIDGEIVLPDGSGVHWRDFYQATSLGPTAEVMVKSPIGARLRSANSILRQWSQA